MPIRINHNSNYLPVPTVKEHLKPGSNTATDHSKAVVLVSLLILCDLVESCLALFSDVFQFCLA